MKPLLAAFVLFAASTGLAWRADIFEIASSPPGEQGSDPLFLAIGSAKEAIGDTLFLKADEYFHGGVREEGSHEDVTAEDLKREGLIPEKEGEGRNLPKDWIAGINGQIRATRDMHLTKEKRNEMLPFFKWATDLDPHNVEAILTTAYWLENEFRKKPEAVALLEKGIRDNPESWELEHDLAKLYERSGDLVSAAPHYREAAHKSVAARLENFERVSMYYEWGKSAEAAGKAKEALDAYARATRYFDPKTKAYLQSVILARIKELSAANTPAR